MDIDLKRRLRSSFVRTAPREVLQPDTIPAAATHAGEVEFVAYGAEWALSGYTRLDADRLTDMLNGYDEYLLADVLVERLADGEATQLKEVLIQRDEVLLVHATGPRGSEQRRHRTRPHPLAFQVGPYHVRGYFHALPGADPITALRRRKAMVPLTDAWIEHSIGGSRQRRRVGTLVVNREQVDWVVPAADEEVEMPDLPIAVAQGPLVKDFTGFLFREFGQR